MTFKTKIHGKKLVDNYKWMKTNKPKAVKLIKQLNKDTEQFHDKLSPIQKQLATLFSLIILLTKGIRDASSS